MSLTRLASYNIRKCVGLDWRRSPHRIADVLAGLGADVVALQEADKRLGDRPAALSRDIIEAQTDLSPVSVPEAGGSVGFHGNAILVGTDWTIDEVEGFELPGLEPRGALIADVHRGNRALRVVGVHLGLLAASRRQQYRALVVHLKTLSARPTVIMGDFNEWQPHRHMAGLEGFEVHLPGPSFHSARPVAALDLFATSQGVRVHHLSVVKTRLTRVASDHLPVTADVNLGEG